MKKLTTLFATVFIVSTALSASSALAGDEVTVTSWGGAYQEAQRKAIFEPFIAGGNKVTEAEYNEWRKAEGLDG